MEIISENIVFLLFCFLSSCFLIFTATTRFRRSSYRSATLPPGPPRLPIIGNIHQVGTNPHRTFADLSKTYGPIMSLKLGRLNSVIIASPEAAREVLKTHDQFLSARKSTNSIRAVNHQEFSVAWLPSSSARWRLLRKLSVSLMFSPQRIEATKAMRMKKVQELVNFVSESSEREDAVDISRASFTTVLNIISNILFSVDLGSYDSKNLNKFQETVIAVMVAVGKPDVANFFPFLGFLDLQSNRKTIKCCTERLLRVFRGFMDAKIALRNESKNDVSNIDFLDSLLALTQGDKTELDNHDIEHLLLDIFSAGTDTNSGTVEWAMAELLKNPKTMAKAQAEIDRLIGQNGVVEESDISELPYLQAVVKETFRLHPAVPLLLPREAETDVEILGFMVPKDAQVMVNVWAIGRDPNVWDNPSQFEPERFLGKEIDVKGRDYELTPFGAGRRICPGLPLAVKIVSLMLASLLYSFEWKLPNGISPEDLDMDETFGITLHKTIPLHAIPVKKGTISSSYSLLFV
ncbi:PREDICTED: cytochrome P450 76C4-like isoform X1 [Camelina sativa]|uniref:Cytochrome P450 76C4-like isoform X1 n=1 Tax=Camelina sativa TaxID=90675 RepID=A0ABM0YZ29_CAMSA|nr:PREDICTED: cytochrome P450 76C4-like isoform X1 [Camelina sativa]